MTILVIAEHDNASILEATLNTVTAASQIGGDIEILVAGNGCQGAADAAAKIAGVSKVHCADNTAYDYMLSENVAPLVAELAAGHSHVLAPATANGKNLLPRISALLDSSQISDVIAVESADTFKRPIYAGNAIATVQSEDEIKVVGVRTSSFDAADAASGNAEIAAVEATHDSGISKFVEEKVVKSERPELTSAKIVVSGGRGVGSAENFAIIEALADKLGAAMGASRAAVDAGFVPNELQVGQTGKIVAPDLYIAIGISGAIQHLAGMKDSGCIVAINKDEDAPIFNVADYGLVADLFDVVPEMTEKLD